MILNQEHITTAPEAPPDENSDNHARRQAHQSGQGGKTISGWVRGLMLLVVVVAALVTAAKLLPLTDYFKWVLERVGGLGSWGPVVLAASYIIACIFMVPGSLLTLGAGFLFHVLLGTVTVSIGSTLGAAAAFLVGRTVGRKWVTRKVESHPKFAALDRAVGREGFKIVLLTRLSPVFPFVLLNYAYGLTRVRFRDYVLASWVGMLPGTVMFVYFGSGLRSLTEVLGGQAQGGTAGRVFFWAGLAVTIVVTVFITRVVRRALQKAVAAYQKHGTD